MNWSEIEYPWDQMKFVVVSHWHKLSDEDLTRINGKQRHFGPSNSGAELPERYGGRDGDLYLRKGCAPPSSGQVSLTNCRLSLPGSR